MLGRLEQHGADASRIAAAEQDKNTVSRLRAWSSLLRFVTFREVIKMPNMNGGCLCGDVRYAATGEPKVVSICHCSHCQKESGSAFVEVVAVPNEAFTIQGATNAFTNTGDSGRTKTRRFCPRCASILLIEAEGFPGMTLIMGGTFDDTSWLKPTLQLFCDSAQPWIAISEDTTNFARMPT